MKKIYSLGLEPTVFANASSHLHAQEWHLWWYYSLLFRKRDLSWREWKNSKALWSVKIFSLSHNKAFSHEWEHALVYDNKTMYIRTRICKEPPTWNSYLLSFEPRLISFCFGTHTFYFLRFCILELLGFWNRNHCKEGIYSGWLLWYGSVCVCSTPGKGKLQGNIYSLIRSSMSN